MAHLTFYYTCSRHYATKAEAFEVARKEAYEGFTPTVQKVMVPLDKDNVMRALNGDGGTDIVLDVWQPVSPFHAVA